MIIAGETNDDRKVEPDSVGSKITLPVTQYDSSGSLVTPIGAATATTIANVTMTDANTEYSYALPSGTKVFRMKLRSQSASFKLSFTSGQSGTTYITVNQGGSYGESGVSLSSKTLYFQSPTAAQTMEVISYS